ncbi:hypothetical protein RhiLY_13235 [Ceratobasidium sp. AG-Ba]|nr:hypothetical protein RhiLY_13235 [Ceratobasidium sp. AG-Ba]
MRIQRCYLWRSTPLVAAASPAPVAAMPATDLTDQQAARAIESSLREAVHQLKRPPVELKWFASLPKRVRRSGQLIEAALVEAKVLLDHIRADWTQAQQIEQEREDRLAKARVQPRDINCLRAPDPTAWNGLGRRKKRCRAFESVGRAYNTRQRALGDAKTVNSTTADTFLLHPSSCYVPKRSPTPPGLRDAIQNVPGLIDSAIGPANSADYGLPTPLTPELPVSEPPAPLMVIHHLNSLTILNSTISLLMGTTLTRIFHMLWPMGAIHMHQR